MVTQHLQGDNSVTKEEVKQMISTTLDNVVVEAASNKQNADDANKVVEAVRKAREEHAAKFNYNLDAIYQDLKKQQKRSRRKVISLPAKRAAVAVRAKVS